MTIEGTLHLPTRAAAPAPAGTAQLPAGVTPETARDMIESSVASGIRSREDADEVIKMFGLPAAAPANAKPATPAPGDTPDPVSASDAAQMAQLAGWMQDAGHFTAEQAKAALAAEGIEAPAAAKPETGLSAEAAEIDAAFPVPQPHEYTLPRLIEEGDPYTPEVAAWDKSVRQIMVDARLPASIGSAIAQEVARFEKTWVAMNPGEQELHVRAEKAALQRLWGDQYDAKLNLVRQLAAEVHDKHPGVFEHLVDKGLFSNAFAIGQLAEHCSRLAARRSK